MSFSLRPTRPPRVDRGRRAAGFVLCAWAMWAGCQAEPTRVTTRRPVTTPTTLGPLDALGRRYGRVRERMRERGFALKDGPARFFLPESEGVEVPVDLARGTCTTLVALGGSGLRELAMTLYDGDGAPVADDEQPGEAALLHVCPPVAAPAASRSAAAPYHVVLEARAGTAAVVMAAFRAERPQPSGFAGLFDGLLAPRVPLRDVETHFSGIRSALRARGYTQVGPPMLGTIAEGEDLRRDVTLDASHCYVLAARGGRGVTDVDLFLYDAAGVEVGRELGRGQDATYEFCPTASGVYSVEARAFEGAGAMGIAVFGGGPSAHPPPTSQALPPRGESPDVVLRAAAHDLEAHGYAAMTVLAEGSDIAAGESRSHDFVTPGGCALVLATGFADGMDIDLYLSDPSGRVQDQDTGIQPLARTVVCADEPHAWRATVKAYGRSGTYALALVRAPAEIRAVYELRIDLAQAPYLARGFTASWRQETTLGEGASWKHAVSVPAGRCTVIVAAGDRGLSDVDLFVRSSEGRLLASDTGPTAFSSVRRCSTAEELGEVEIVAYRGAGRVTVVALEGAGP